MLQCILAIACPELHLAQQPDQFGMDAMHAYLKRGGLSLLLNHDLHFFLRLLHHLLDPGGMDASIYDQLFQRDPGHLPADGVESRQDHRFRRIVDDQIDAGHGLQGADVAPLPSDDPSLHLIVWQLYDGNRGLRDMVCSTSLDS